MSVRELFFDIGFGSDVAPLLKADQAVDRFKSKVIGVGSAADQSIGKAVKEFNKLPGSIAKADRATISFVKDMKGMVAKSKIGQSMSEVGQSIKLHLGKTMTVVSKTSKEKLEGIGAAVKGSLGRAFPETSRHGRITIGIMNDLGRAGKASFSAITTYVGKANEANQRFSQSMKSLSEQMKGISSASGKIGNSLMTKVTLPLSVTAGKIIKSGMDFEAGMSEVKALSGASAEDMEKLTKKAREMGKTTKFSAIESAQALKYMGMAGWDTDKMLAGLPGVMNLAAASGEELGTVSDIVTDSMTAFGLSADQSAHFADVLAQASSKSNTSIGLMGETFKYAAPVAGALGYSIEDTAIAIGLMANKGIKGSQAGTALRSSFSNLAKPTKQMQSAMGELGISLTDSQGKMKPFRTVMDDMRKSFSTLSEAQKAQYAATIFGQEAMSGMLAVIDTSEEEYRKLTSAIDSAQGAAKNQADIMKDNLKGQFTELGSALSEVGIQIYNILAPSMKKGVEYVHKLVDQFSEMDEKTKLTALKIIGLAMAAGPLFKIFQFAASGIGLFTSGLSVVGKLNLFKVFSSWGKGVGFLIHKFLLIKSLGFGGMLSKIGSGFAFLGTSIVPVIITIGALVAAGYLLYKNWDTVKAKGIEFVSSLQMKFASFLPAVSAIWENLKTIFFALLPVFSGIFSGIGSVLGGFLNKAADVVGALLTIFQGVTDFVAGVFTGNWEQAWTGIQTIFSGIFEGIKSIFTGAINFITGGINTLIRGFNKLGAKLPGGKAIQIPEIPQFASGVDNFSGGLAIVGEQGPELVHLPKGSSVTPSRETSKMMKNNPEIRKRKEAEMIPFPKKQSTQKHSVQNTQTTSQTVEDHSKHYSLQYQKTIQNEKNRTFQQIEPLQQKTASTIALPQPESLPSNRNLPAIDHDIGPALLSELKHQTAILTIDRRQEKNFSKEDAQPASWFEQSPLAPNNYSRSSKTFSPIINIHMEANSEPEKVAELTKNRIRELFEEFIDEADQVS